jgi:uncharacterized repeat protein (TIGR04138 family)
MNESDFIESIKSICARDNRYEPDAYLFVREALDYTVKKLKKPADGPARHVTGQELLEGIRVFALHEYGPMALTVLKSWRINHSSDFGEIVFNLVESGKLGKTDHDKKEDFSDGYDFVEAFARPFLPAPKIEEKGKNVRRLAGRKSVARRKTTQPG